ncbi:MAG TPA: hypothetical protein VII99_06535, partial [Bacteroidia bacterium]
MKKIILLFLLLSNHHFILAQLLDRNIENKIIENEKRAAQTKINFQENPITSNYDIIYDQCFWNIDPTVRFISGNINTFFIPKANLTSIALDLSDSL